MYDLADRERKEVSPDLPEYIEEYNIKFFTEEMGEEVRERFSLETHLTKALEKEEFSLCFQPIVNIRENSVEAVEALLRWENAILGFIPPDKFI
ncbi:MAG: EAL domain-containing protein [Firmicutes bacterium]|nr:EAL domain-containing protein [Bacillota bacterium]